MGICAFGIRDAFYKRFQTEAIGSSSGKKSENWRKEFEDNLERGVVDIGLGPQTIEELKQDYRNLGVLMGVHWVSMLHKVWVKITIVVLAIGWYVIALNGVLSIKLLQENENFTGEHGFLMKSLHGMQDYDPMRNQIRILFGVKGLESRDVWVEDYGVIDYYENVGFHTEAQQLWMLEYCEILRNWTSTKQDDMMLVLGDDDVNCVVEKFRDYIESSASGLDNASYPLLKPGNDVSDEEQKEYYLAHFYEWYHQSDDGISQRNGFKADIAQKSAEKYELKSIRYAVVSAADFWSIQSDADLEEDRWHEFMAESCAACGEALGDVNDPLCHPRISSPRWSWSEGMYILYESTVCSKKLDVENQVTSILTHSLQTCLILRVRRV